MSVMEILTLLLVVFAALSYIDDHNNKKIASLPPKVWMLFFIFILRAIGTRVRSHLNKLYNRAACLANDSVG